MKTASISKLKATLSEHIAWVKRGEEVLVTERGKPVARIVPVRSETDEDRRMERLAKRGLVRLGRGGLSQLLPHLPVADVPEGLLQRIMDEEREDRV